MSLTSLLLHSQSDVGEGYGPPSPATQFMMSPAAGCECDYSIDFPDSKMKPRCTDGQDYGEAIAEKELLRQGLRDPASMSAMSKC